MITLRSATPCKLAAMLAIWTDCSDGPLSEATVSAMELERVSFTRKKIPSTERRDETRLPVCMARGDAEVASVRTFSSSFRYAADSPTCTERQFGFEPSL